MINFFKSLIRRKEKRKPCKGNIMLGFGQHEIVIKIDKTPCKVALSLNTQCDGTPVCQGDVNKIGFNILKNGFVLYADIKTNTCCVEWICDT